ncbi:MAG: TauD/TfdA family dioxygenase [Pseudomonadota bacterium]
MCSKPIPFETSPLTSRFGAACSGIDLRDVTATHLYPELRTLFERESALLFRNQEIAPEDHIRLAKLFGPLEDRKSDERGPGADFKIPEVSNVLSDGTVTGAEDLHTLNLKANQLWHTDSTFLPVPALANILIARVVTATGGETELASTRAAWRDMPETMRAKLRGKRARHRYSHSRARISPDLANLPMFNKWDDQTWPALWRNPVTGEDAIYIASHACAIEGMDPADGAALIDDVIAFCTQPAYTYCHAWAKGDVLIWDERATLHRGRPWNYAEPRALSSICVSVTEADGLSAMRS